MNRGQHAIVLGASVSGLAAARVLSDHYTRVTVLERGRLPVECENRRAVPQGNHAHVLLCEGYRALERMFPGLGRALVERGALEAVLGRDLCFFNEGQPLAAAPSDLRTLLVSRALLEGSIRQRVRELPNVTIEDGVTALDLVADGDAIRGVTVTGDADSPRTRTADLVVDATGRGSRLGEWLDRLGFDPAPEQCVRVDVSYTSCTYRYRPDQAAGYKALALSAAPPNRRTGVAVVQEGDRWIVTLVGYLGERAEPSHAGMLDFARGLPNRAIYNLLSSAQPLSEPVSMRFPFSRRRRYERLNRFPSGLLALGDTLCSFNPSFGQGMTVAALEAGVLDDCLRHPKGPVWKAMFRQCARLIDTPWSLAVGADLAFREVQGKRTTAGALLGRYVKALRRGAVHDDQLALAFLRVVQLVDPPSALLAPTLAWRTLRARSISTAAPLASEPRHSLVS